MNDDSTNLTTPKPETPSLRPAFTDVYELIHALLLRAPVLTGPMPLTLRGRATDVWALTQIKRDLAAIDQAVTDHLDLAKAMLADLMEEQGRPVERVAKCAIALVDGHTVQPRIDDLMPPGVEADDEQYKDTVDRVRESARQRLVNTLRALPAFSDLVFTDYDGDLLTREVCGDDAPTDAAGDPILPEPLKPVLSLVRFRTVVMADGGGAPE